MSIVSTPLLLSLIITKEVRIILTLLELPVTDEVG